MRTQQYIDLLSSGTILLVLGYLRVLAGSPLFAINTTHYDGKKQTVR